MGNLMQTSPTVVMQNASPRRVEVSPILFFGGEKLADAPSAVPHATNTVHPIVAKG
jgi:hypothetical protein